MLTISMTIFHAKAGGQINGEVGVPGDKSISHRSIMLSAIGTGKSVIRGFLHAEDTLNTLKAFQALGVDIKVYGDEIVVDGVGLRGLKSQSNQVLDVGNSGTAIRLMAGLLSGHNLHVTLTGDQSLTSRPMGRIITPLQKMGACIQSNQDCAPLQLMSTSQLRGIQYEMPMASAQVKSAILLAGLYAEGASTVIEPAPSRDHTERMLSGLGCKLHQEKNHVTIHPAEALSSGEYIVPGDFSSACFLIVAALICPGSELCIKNVGINPSRTGAFEILKKMGADITLINQQEVMGEPVADIVVRHTYLKGIQVPESLVPLAIDEFPIIAIAAACAEGLTTVSGAQELRVKESDRISSVVTGLRNLGIDASELSDGMVIKGGELKGGQVDSFGDHRIAMSFAIAALKSHTDILIQNCDNVATSFPSFVKLFNGLGLKIDAS